MPSCGLSSSDIVETHAWYIDDTPLANANVPAGVFTETSSSAISVYSSSSSTVGETYNLNVRVTLSIADNAGI